jgi:multiple sugar transport system substrate-binding protein
MASKDCHAAGGSTMLDRKRRQTLKALGGAAAALVGQGVLAQTVSAADSAFTLEKGAKLRVLRWKRFVQGDEEQWLANTKKYAEKTGIAVRVDSENFEELRPKAAVAANVGAGPDIVIGTNEDPHQYPDKLNDLTDLADYLGNKYGGWYDVCREFGMYNGRWIALITGAAGGAIVYRPSQIQAAGFAKIPADLQGFLKLCQALKAKGTPPGFALGHAVGDANGLCFWLLWAFGGKVADSQNNVALDSKETLAALEYAKELYQTFIPGTLSWLDPNNNKAFLAGEISLTQNGISIYYSAKHATDEKTRALAADIQHAVRPFGPVGHDVTGALMFPAFVFKYCKYPNAAKDYLRFMMEKEQYDAWQAACIGFVSHPLKAYETSPVWSADPQHAFFRDTVKNARHAGYAGKLGKASAAMAADFIVVDMFAEVCSGQQTPKAAAQRAQKRAERYYKA